MRKKPSYNNSTNIELSVVHPSECNNHIMGEGVYSMYISISTTHLVYTTTNTEGICIGLRDEPAHQTKIYYNTCSVYSI